MKKCLSICLALVLLTALALPAQAATTAYKLRDLELSLHVPSEYDVFLRNIAETDPLFSEYGISKSDLMKEFTARDIYLDAISPSGDDEIVVTMVENSVESFRDMDDSFLLSIAASMEEQSALYGYTITGYDIYRHPQLTFLRFYFYNEANDIHGLQYYTIHNNQAMNFTLRSFTGRLSTAQAQTILALVDSIYLYSDTAPAATSAPTEAFEFTDPDTGVTFTVPENWEVGTLTESREFLDCSFASVTDSRMVIYYGSTDLWSQMSESEKEGYTRSDFNNSALTVSDAAEILGVSSSEVKEVTYNGKTYFKGKVTTSAEAYGVERFVTMTHVFCYENGWMYWFAFSGTPISEYYDDFELLLNTVEYPQTGTEYENTDPKPEDTSPRQEDTDTSGSSFDIGYAILYSIVLIAIVVCVVIVVVSRQKKAAAQQRIAAIHNSPQEQAPPSNEAPAFCRMCGAQLPPDSFFCPKCGSKVAEPPEQ